MCRSPLESALSFINSCGLGVRVGVIESPDYVSPWLIYSFVANLPDGCVIVSGGSGNVDKTAVNTAKDFGREYIEYKPDWGRYKRGSTHVRNKQIATDQLCCLVAFLNSIYNPSDGSYDAMRLALEAGVPLFMFGPADNFIFPWMVANKQLCFDF